MPERPELSAGLFEAAFKEFLEQAVARAAREAPVFVRRLQAHFGADPATLPVLSEQFEPAEHPNLQVALDAYLHQPDRSAELLGIVSDQKKWVGVGFSDLLEGPSDRVRQSAAAVGPVQWVNLPLASGEALACVDSGLFLVRTGQGRLAVLVSGPGRRRGMGFKLEVEVMASSRERAAEWLNDLRAGMRRLNVYRGRVVSLSMSPDRTLQVQFHTLPRIARENVILPEGLLARVERHTLGFGRQQQKLRAAGRHLKRGILLHGSPGTGKTLTAMYLAGQMSDRTILVLTGRAVTLIPQSCAMARLLQPSMLILEDVDLVAEERTQLQDACLPLLFELLNEIDGLADDADVIFLLTTNRPDLLEPALAARPGRVDQAVELPLPDAASRRRLFALYGQGLSVRVDRLDEFVERTDGVSAAFIRELLRKAALFAAEASDEIVVEDRHLDAALHELVVEGGALTKTLLGVRSPS